MESTVPSLPAQFILAHDSDPDPLRLLLSKGAREEVPDLETAVNTLLCRKKAKSKLPTWHSHPQIIYPTTLCIEQCSSEATASYKAHLARAILGTGENGKGTIGCTVADLTGGLGVDSAAFASIPEVRKVIYNEMNPVLSNAARRNFAVLGLGDKVQVHSVEITDATSMDDILGEEVPDLIFLDPGRRSDEGKKVFLLSDCHPDVTSLAGPLLQRCHHILLKISPMADISMVCSQLPNVREVHCVQSGGECKEVLLHLERECSGEGHDLIAAVLSPASEPFLWRFHSTCPKSPDIKLPSREEGIPEGAMLFEPGKALSKCGVFARLCEEFSLIKLGTNTHLYLTTPLSPTSTLSRLGKVRPIVESLPLSKASMKTLSRKYPGAEVSAKNIPLTSEQLSSKLATKNAAPKGAFHIYGAGIQWKEGNDEKYLIVTL